MIILLPLGILFLIAFISTAYSDIRDSYNSVVAREKEEQRQMFEESRLEREAADRRKEKRAELQKQLDGVRYQLTLVEQLDDFRRSQKNPFMAERLTEQDIKKELALEKQYNTLWTKERKLKRELEKLDG